MLSGLTVASADGFCCCLFSVCSTSHCVLGFTVRPLFYLAVLCVLSGFTIISLGKIAGCFTFVLFCMSCRCYLWLFFAVPWVGLWHLMVIRTYFLYCEQERHKWNHKSQTSTWHPRRRRKTLTATRQQEQNKVKQPVLSSSVRWLRI